LVTRNGNSSFTSTRTKNFSGHRCSETKQPHSKSVVACFAEIRKASSRMQQSRIRGHLSRILLRSIGAKIGHVHSAINQNRRPPIVKGGSPPKKRHIRSPPPFALHLKYAPTSGSDWKRSCGMTPPLPSEGKLPEATFPWNTLMVGPSDDSASNPGMFISSLLNRFQV
jgi:hypothetical protein